MVRTVHSTGYWIRLSVLIDAAFQVDIRQQFEEELRSQHAQLKISGKMAFMKDQQQNHVPRKRGRKPKAKPQPTIVNINSEPMSRKPKGQQSLPSGNAIEISIRTASPSGNSKEGSSSHKLAATSRRSHNDSAKARRFISSNDDNSTTSSNGGSGMSSLAY